MPANPLDDWTHIVPSYQPPSPIMQGGPGVDPAIQGSPGAGTSGGLMTGSPPGLQIPPGQGNSPFGWRMPGRRIPMPPQMDGANRQAMIAQALQGFNNQYPNWQQQIQPMPPTTQPMFDPMMQAGGQIGAHGPLNYLGQPIIKGNG